MSKPNPDHSDQTIARINHVLNILEEHNGAKYITPNPNYLKIVYNAPDILSMYSNEISDLREMLLTANSLCLDIKYDPVIPIDKLRKSKKLKKLLQYCSRQPWTDRIPLPPR